MSLDACIPELVASGDLTREQGDYVRELYDKLRKRQRQTFGRFAADASAGFDTVRQLETEAVQQRRQALLDVSAKKAILDATGTYRGRRGKDDFGRAAEAVFVGDDRAPYANVEYREMNRRNRALGMLDKLLAQHSRNFVGAVRDKAGTLDILRELRGESTGNRSAAEIASAVQQVQELLRLHFNAAGGAIRKLENRGVAQRYKPELVQPPGMSIETARARWKADVKDALDTGKMIDHSTGKPFTPEALDGLLDDVFESIRTDGANKREPGGMGGLKLANRRQEQRVLIYKSADDWQRIAEKYGDPNVFDAIMDEVHGMARDIAAMEILGPNPAGTVKWLKDVVQDRAATKYGAGSPEAEQAKASADRIQAYWDVLSGASARGQRNFLSLLGGNLRNLQTASKLGSATLTALPTDMATQALTRAFNGLPVSNMALGYMRQLASSGAREQATRLGFIADQAAHGFSQQARFLGQELSGETSARLADGVIRASGLNAITDAGRQAFGLEMLGHITDERGKTWGQLDRRFRRMFERYGIGEEGWNDIRSTKPSDVGGGALFIRPELIENERTADAMMEMIYREMDHAVVTARTRARAAIAPLKRGTALGEIGRSLFQFKAFPLTTLFLHGARMAALEGGGSKARYAATAIGLTTLAGWMAMQAKAISKGQDPRPMNFKTLMASLQQGGGLGIYGDFLFSTKNRAGQGFSSTIMGPSVQTIDALSGLVAGAPLLQAEGEKVDYDKQLIRLLRSETPGSSLWYARLAFERLLLDQWQAAADPHYRQSWRRTERNADKLGTQFWWSPGETSPERTPDLSNAGPSQ